MDKYEDIRFFNADEVNKALQSGVRHPMIKTLFDYTFPDKSDEEIKEVVLSCHSIDDFQREVIYESVQQVLKNSSQGLSSSGFENLDQDTSYVYMSNHRDIILDTSLLNVTLFDHGLIRTASAIGDNLVQKPFIHMLSRLTRNFLVKRGLSPREMLRSSQNLSEYIRFLLKSENRSVWIAQREGRTKDGNDRTQQGVLKMIAMAKGDQSIVDYFNNLRIVPVSISYEYDPTDILKVPEVLAKAAQEEYIKSPNEDFNSMLKGALGQKKHIHITAGQPLTIEDSKDTAPNMVLKEITALLDRAIHSNYKLWPTNYIASDILRNSDQYKNEYTEKDRKQFERRLRLRVRPNDATAVESFLLMYAQPVINKENTHVAYNS